MIDERVAVEGLVENLWRRCVSKRTAQQSPRTRPVQNQLAEARAALIALKVWPRGRAKVDGVRTECGLQKFEEKICYRER
jgi:hypothetical protein